MGWHLAVCDEPGKPFAVVDGHGAVAGTHATRAAATIQMQTLNVEGVGDGASGATQPGLKPSKKKVDETPDTSAIGKQVPWQAPPIAYTTPTTQAW